MPQVIIIFYLKYLPEVIVESSTTTKLESCPSTIKHVAPIRKLVTFLKLD